jgi:hypothetical protein
MLASGIALPAASRCAVAPAREAMMFAAYAPIASTSAPAFASTNTAVLGETTKLSAGETSMVDGWNDGVAEGRFAGDETVTALVPTQAMNANADSTIVIEQTFECR